MMRFRLWLKPIHSYQPTQKTATSYEKRSHVVGSNSVRQQAVFQTARQTCLAIVENSQFANTKQHFSLFNGSGSGRVIRVQKLFMTNMVETAVSGGTRRIDVKKITACSGGTDITPIKQDSL